MGKSMPFFSVRESELDESLLLMQVEYLKSIGICPNPKKDKNLEQFVKHHQRAINTSLQMGF